MKRETNVESLKSVIDRLLKVYRLEDKYNEVRVLSQWESLMGGMVAKRTEQIYVKNKVLHVKLNSAPLREELSLGKNKIVKLLNEKHGAVFITDVRFY